ncbi:MAG: SGNH/GDSL hydrolase family protein [Alcanivoracaceae bacterium]|nr:SGNH/GDSL hydrolase family protein [Alcanivoracaceae bacterium]
MTTWWRLSAGLFWLCAVLLLPVLVWQGRRVRRDTLRLPEASGATSGQWGAGDPQRRILVIGESTAAGVGVDRHEQGLASELARALHDADGGVTRWHTVGHNGARLDQLSAGLAVASLPDADTVLLSMGVNDTTAFTGLAHYRGRLLRLREQLRDRFPAPLVLLSVPPMHRFTALPQPLRLMVGWRARLLDGVKKQLARHSPEAFVHISYPALTDPALLARDGYHPGADGYRAMAAAVACALVERGPSGP